MPDRARPAGGSGGPAGHRPRLAIVSTFDDLCGIAGYTRALINQLEAHFDIEVFDLDQFFMRSRNEGIRKTGDRMIKDFCARAKTFDFVNIQFEYGTLGTTRPDIVRRLTWIMEAAPALSVTFHTVLAPEQLNLLALLNEVSKRHLVGAVNVVRHHVMNGLLLRNVYSLLRRMQRVKPVNIIVHTRRDMRALRYVQHLDSVVDHPLVFMNPEEAGEVRARSSRADFPVLAHLASDAKLIGVFGFLADYKGFDVVVRALHLLPPDYHLAIFGGVHPNEIVKRQAINPYVGRLLDEAYVSRSIFDDLQDTPVSISIDAVTPNLFRHPNDIGDRIHFLGAQSDDAFARGMAVCDHVVLPYVEVGQSASGVLSIAHEMGARVIAARNHAFMQFTRYHPNAIELFDIGNHLELASKIAAGPAYPPGHAPPVFDTNTNTAVYVAANSREARAAPAMAAKRERVASSL